MNNIILIGMTGAGKTTIGRELARKLMKEFFDTDKLIQDKVGLSPRKIVETKSRDFFMELQDDIIGNLDVKNSVISTGGSVVESHRAMEVIKKLGKVIYLDVPFSVLDERMDKSRPLAGKGSTTFFDLFLKREPLYKKNADIICPCEGKSVDMIVEWIKKRV